MGTVRLSIVLLFLTIGHLVLRASDGPPERETIRFVSALSPGQPIPHLDVLSVRGELESGTLVIPFEPCQLVVVVDPSCPSAWRAARRAASAAHSPSLPTTWVIPTPDLNMLEVLENRPDSRFVWTPLVLDSLKIEALPAAFLLDGEGRIKRFWAFQGDEDPDDLRRECVRESEIDLSLRPEGWM